MSPAQVGREFTSADIAEMMAWEHIYGIPDIYFLTAQVCRTVVASMTGTKTTPGDFVPYWQTPPKEQTAEEQQEIVRSRLRGMLRGA